MSLLNNLKEEYFMGIFKKLTDDEEKFFDQLSNVATAIKNNTGDPFDEYKILLQLKQLPQKSKFYRLQTLLKSTDENIGKIYDELETQKLVTKYKEALAANCKQTQNAQPENLGNATKTLTDGFDKEISKIVIDSGRKLEQLHKCRLWGDRHDAKKHVQTIFRSLISGSLRNGKWYELIAVG